MNNEGLTKLDIIEAYIEMKMRDLDMQKELIKNNPDSLIDKIGLIDSAKISYSDIYKFIGTIRLKEQIIKERFNK